VKTSQYCTEVCTSNVRILVHRKVDNARPRLRCKASGILFVLHAASYKFGMYSTCCCYELYFAAYCRNIVRQYQKSGFLWEQYDAKTGKGKGSHPFTGWTALVVLIISEQYY